MSPLLDIQLAPEMWRWQDVTRLVGVRINPKDREPHPAHHLAPAHLVRKSLPIRP